MGNTDKQTTIAFFRGKNRVFLFKTKKGKQKKAKINKKGGFRAK